MLLLQHAVAKTPRLYRYTLNCAVVGQEGEQAGRRRGGERFFWEAVAAAAGNRRVERERERFEWIDRLSRGEKSWVVEDHRHSGFVDLFSHIVSI